MSINTIVNGWWSKARIQASPNFSERPKSTEVDLLVIHNISLPPGEFGGAYVEQFFTNQLDFNAHPWFENIKDIQVSAHCFIKREGETVQFVSFDAKAWHAGESQWKGRTNCNAYSIGIELEGSDTIAYTEAQYRSLVELSKSLMMAYPGINLENIVGHEDIAPGRKTDPGPAFDWEKYRNYLLEK